MMPGDSAPVAVALRASLAEGYTLRKLKSDALAALVVSLVALPLAMALSIAVGLPPQHGLYTAIVAGMVVPLLGGSAMQVSGPTAAFVVIVAPIVAEHGLRGLLVTTFMAGILLVFLGMARLGRYIQYIPYPVTTGFTAGIAVVIATLSLNDLLGLSMGDVHGGYLSKLAAIAAHLPALHAPEALVGLASLLVMCTSGRIIRWLPSSVAGIGVGTLLAYMLQQHGFAIDTIGNRFSYALDGGGTGRGIPPFLPSFHIPGWDGSALFAWPSFAEIRLLLVPALVIAALGALESLLSATVADGMAGTRHHPNSELVGIGIGNVLSALAAGMPATGAIARTSTNIYSGAKTPFAASFHAVLILLYVLLLAPAMSSIPMASLAALLVVVAFRMSHYRQFIRILQIAPRSDIIVLLACFAFTVFVDMVAGVTAGVVLSCFLLMQRVAHLTHSQVSHNSSGHHRKLRHLTLGDDTMVYHISGLVFFGTVERALERTGFIGGEIKTLIIDLEDVPFIDMSGLVAMKTMLLGLQSAGRRIILCGAPEVTGRIWRKLPLGVRYAMQVAETLEQAVALGADTGR